MPDLLALLRDRGLPCRKVSAAHGGEYAGPCPLCGGTDRFHVWPDRRSDSGISPPGRWWCRQCGASGDLIAYLMQVDGLSFGDACGVLGIDRPARPAAETYRPAPTPRTPEREWSPRDYGAGPEQWRTVAEQFLAAAQERLAHDPAAQSWLDRRGISARWAAEYGLGYYEARRGGDGYASRASWGLPPEMKNGKPRRLWLPRGWVIPCRGADGELLQLRIRRRPDDVSRFAPEIKYLPVAGSSQATLVLHPEAEAFVVVESGFDAILLARHFGGRIGAVCPWSAAARPDARAHDLLSRALCVLLALDYDPAGESGCAWYAAQYRHAVRLPALPGGAKDPGDAYAAGADLYAWLRHGMPSGLAARLGLCGPETVRTPQAAEEPAPTHEQSSTVPEPAPVREPTPQPTPEPTPGPWTEYGSAADHSAEFAALLEAEEGVLWFPPEGGARIVWPPVDGDAAARNRAAILLYGDGWISALVENIRRMLANRVRRIGWEDLREFFGLEDAAA